MEEEEEKEETEDDGGNLPWLDALEDFEVDEAEEGEGAATPELAIVEFVGAASEQELRTSGQQTPENIEGLVLASSRTDKINKRILQVCEGLADGSMPENRHYVSTAVRAVMLDVDRKQLRVWEQDLVAAALQYERLMFDKLQASFDFSLPRLLWRVHEPLLFSKL